MVFITIFGLVAYALDYKFGDVSLYHLLVARVVLKLLIEEIAVVLSLIVASVLDALLKLDLLLCAFLDHFVIMQLVNYVVSEHLAMRQILHQEVVSLHISYLFFIVVQVGPFIGLV
jgi:hypothetical protein